MNLQELPKLKDSVTYLYMEHAIIEQDESAVVAIKKEGKIPIPISQFTCLLLGPGTTITHAAIRTMASFGCMVIWCGEAAGRFYASGLGETRSSKNLLLQASACMDKETHMEVVRRMYDIRFPGIDTSQMTLQQIRGMEGIRMKKAYELAAKSNGVSWKRRSYKRDNWDDADPINQALSMANALLYGVCHAAVVSLGLSPGLGFVHTGKQLSFVYDIADLYKAETTIPAAFEAVKNATDTERLDQQVRLCCRKYFHKARLLNRISEDVAMLLNGIPDEIQNDEEAGDLWDDRAGCVKGGVLYSRTVEEET